MTPKQERAVINALWSILDGGDWLARRGSKPNDRTVGRSIRAEAKAALKRLGSKERPTEPTP